MNAKNTKTKKEVVNIIAVIPMGPTNVVVTQDMDLWMMTTVVEVS